MNSFLVQVGFDKNANIDSYANIMYNRRYVNPRWKHKPRDKYHGMVESGDRLLVYCTARVSNIDHKSTLVFSVNIKSVSNDRTTFELEEPQRFKNPLKYRAIHEYIKQGNLDDIFSKCGEEGFNIIKLEPTAVEQIFDLVEPQIPSRQARPQTALGRGRRAVRAAVRRLRGRRG